MMHINFFLITLDYIPDITQKNKFLKLVLEYCQSGQCPDSVNVGKELRPYYNKREELSLENGIILWGLQFVLSFNY